MVAYYEKIPRKQFLGEDGKRMKVLLPIKDKGKVIQQLVEDNDEEEDNEEEDTTKDQGKIFERSCDI